MKASKEEQSVARLRDAYERVSSLLHSSAGTLPPDVHSLLARLVEGAGDKESDGGRALRLVGGALALSEHLLSTLEVKLRPANRESPEYQVYQHLVVDLWGRHQSAAALWGELIKLGDGRLSSREERGRLCALSEEIQLLLSRYVSSALKFPKELLDFSQLAALGCEWLRPATNGGSDPISALWSRT